MLMHRHAVFAIPAIIPSASGCFSRDPNVECGNGIVEEGEECDRGDNNSDALANACRSTCNLPSCGDGVVDDGESCDESSSRCLNCSLIASCDPNPCFQDVECTLVATGVVDCGPCPSGYDGDGVSCVDTDGCSAEPCADGILCTDVAAPGTSLSLYDEVLAVGAPNQDFNEGSVFIYRLVNGGWEFEDELKAQFPGSGDNFGNSVSLQGTTLIVGAPQERSNATGINGDQDNNSLSQAGAVYVFEHTGTVWQQTAFVKPTQISSGDNFGWSVSLSGTVKLKAFPVGAGDRFGRGVALKGDIIAAVSGGPTGAPAEGNTNAAMLYTYRLVAGSWVGQQARLSSGYAVVIGDRGATYNNGNEIRFRDFNGTTWVDDAFDAGVACVSAQESIATFGPRVVRVSSGTIRIY